MSKRCPRCPGSLRPTDLGALPADSCENCHGMWIASEFFSLWKRSRKGSGERTPAEGLATSERQPTSLVCTDCTAPLERVNLRGVTIERCTGCRGLFFEAGELQRIEARVVPRSMEPLGGVPVRSSSESWRISDWGDAAALLIDLVAEALSVFD